VYQNYSSLRGSKCKEGNKMIARTQITVVRDAEWDDIYLRTSGSPEHKERMANTVWKVRRVNEYELYAKEARTCKFIEKVSDLKPIQKSVVAKCQAVNMNNKPCQFRAVCGKFCKKHKVDVGAVFGKGKLVKLVVEEEDDYSESDEYTPMEERVARQVAKLKALEEEDSDSDMEPDLERNEILRAKLKLLESDSDSDEEEAQETKKDEDFDSEFSDSDSD
jgi:hypothetical protein